MSKRLHKIYFSDISDVRGDLGKLEEKARYYGVSRNMMTERDQWFRDIKVESYLDNGTPPPKKKNRRTQQSGPNR